MINFTLGSFIATEMLLNQEIAVALTRSVRPPVPGTTTPDPNPVIVTDEDRSRAIVNVQAIGRDCAKLLLVRADDRIGRTMDLLRFPGPITYADLRDQLLVLKEAIQDDAKFEYFYHYPRQRGLALMRVVGDWAPAIRAFADLKAGIDEAIDCHALGHNLACVFHLMRIMEVGVQRFGTRLGVKLTKLTPSGRLQDLTWHQILDALNPKLRAMPQNTPKAKAKHEQFSAIQSHLYAAKDAWRNPTMHPRKAGYTDGEAQNLINHVRAFMNELASVVSP